jgi:hypothetical protein
MLKKTPSFRPETLRMMPAGQGKVLSVQCKGIFQTGKEHEASINGLHCQQSMISSGIAVSRSTGCVVSQCIGQKPFTIIGGIAG